MRKYYFTTLVLIAMLSMTVLLSTACTNKPEDPGTNSVTDSTDTADGSSTSDSGNSSILTDDSSTSDPDYASTDYDFIDELTREELEIYNRGPEPDIVYDKHRSYNRELPQNKTVKIDDKEISLNYCFSVDTPEEQHTNISTIHTLVCYLDKNDNIYYFTPSGDLKKYISNNYYERVTFETKITKDTALERAKSFCKDTVPGFEKLTLYDSLIDEDRGYAFFFHFKVSDIFVKNFSIDVAYNGEIRLIHSSIDSDFNTISAAKEKKVLDDLDEYISKNFKNIQKYEYDNRGYVSKVNDYYVVTFSVEFTGKSDDPEIAPKFAEMIAIKLE